ncbi:MAG: RagB/SusD family nutrient uptake outer membrane protein [Cyclobacteriaceae bacterium]|nr:RagB/SusD family nutrient uptake outer membrane protein [Cyclobacteriaceae bacterium]
MFRAVAVAVLILGVGCQDLLDLQTKTALSDATAFATPERIALTVAGVYDAAQSGTYAGGAVRGYPFGAAHVEQGDARGEDVFNTQAFFLITYHATYDGTTANNDWHFQTLFRLINRINVVLAGLDGATPQGAMTQTVIDGYKGEVRFLRALAYHELLKHFCRPYSDNPNAPLGGMPLRTEPITGASSAAAGVEVGRSTVAETYAFVLADLNYAESVLPETRDNVGMKITRAVKAAAIALKTRVYLHMGDWPNVITEGNKIASQSAAPFSYTPAGINLPTDPYAAFSTAGSKSNSESIFSIENSAIDNASVNGGLPTMYSTSAPPTGGRALVAISPLIWNQPWFLATDIRKSDTFVSWDENPAGTTGGKGGLFTKKYTDITTLSDNAPVIRYAEVLLNMAEAIQRQAGLGGAPDARAFAMYDAVRSRSVSDPDTDEITDFATGTDLVHSILNERRIEFLKEGLRWGDIHRLAQDATFNTWGGGIPAKVTSNMTNVRPLYTGDPATNDDIMANPAQRHAAIPYANKEFVWPIPNSETNLNPTLAAQQNPGW